MRLFKRILKAIAYRATKNEWRKWAVHASYDTLGRTQVYLRELDLVLARDTGLPLLIQYPLARELKKQANGIFTLREDKLLLEIEGVQIEIQTAEDIFIAHEIFVNRCYEFHCSGDVVVIDIGMNVAMASLFFANHKQVKKVYSFEPLTPTYHQAQQNLGINAEINLKIKTFNFGLGALDHSLDIEYSVRDRGRIGVMGTKLVKNEMIDIQKETISIKQADKILLSILEAHKKDTIVMKMDCEGSEHDIIPMLESSGCLEKIDMIMMEWHDREPSKIVKSLTQSGFKAFKSNSAPLVGMIYAIRN